MSWKPDFTRNLHVKDRLDHRPWQSVHFMNGSALERPDIRILIVPVCYRRTPCLARGQQQLLTWFYGFDAAVQLLYSWWACAFFPVVILQDDRGQ